MNGPHQAPDTSAVPTPATTGFFEEAPGRKSSTRLFSFLLLLFFFVLNGLYFLKSDGPVDLNFLVWDLMILLAVFTPKYLHKIKEVGSLIQAGRTDERA